MNRHDAPSVVFIALRMAVHARASGYDRLQDYLAGTCIRPPEDWSVMARVAAKSLGFLTGRSGSQWYHRQNLVSEMQAARIWLSHEDMVFHFLYGENSYRYLGHARKVHRRNAIICTYHTPRRRFESVVKDRRHISRIDAAIAVSMVQMDYLAEMLTPERVHFVPHGIDVAFFQPGLRKSGAEEILQCLFVGNHLRDIDTLVQAARMLEDNPRVRFTLVTKPENAARFSGMRNVAHRDKVGDADLLRLYQDSDLLVFPLLDCTANNTLLEAMACGLPVLTTDLPGVRDYVSPQSAVLVRGGDADQLCEALVALEEGRERLGLMQEAGRLRALEFRWENVATMIRDVYARTT